MQKTSPLNLTCTVKTALGRIFLFAIFSLTMVGCATVTKLEHTPEELRAAIRGGELVEKDDRVVVKTATRGEVSLVVTEVDDKAIHGVDQVVPIDDVVALEKLEFGRAPDVIHVVFGSVMVFVLVSVATAYAVVSAAL